MRTFSRLPRILSVALLSFTLGASTIAPLAAQEATPVSSPAAVATDGILTVTGMGTVDGTPDTASVSLGISSRDASLEKAQGDVNTRATAVRDVLINAGIAEKDIATSGYYVSPVAKYDRDGNYEGIDYYDVALTYTVTVRDIETVGTLLDQAVNAGANYVGGISMYVNDPAPMAAQAREQAIADARAKADAYAQGTNSRIVGIRSIVETSSPAPASYEYDGAAMRSSSPSDASASVPVSTGTTSISVSVQIDYIIVPAGN